MARVCVSFYAGLKIKLLSFWFLFINWVKKNSHFLPINDDYDGLFAATPHSISRALDWGCVFTHSVSYHLRLLHISHQFNFSSYAHAKRSENKTNPSNGNDVFRCCSGSKQRKAHMTCHVWAADPSKTDCNCWSCFNRRSHLRIEFHFESNTAWIGWFACQRKNKRIHPW